MFQNSLTLFFPCYNDAGTIGSLVAAADVVGGRLVRDYEIIVVDDGSIDGSRQLLNDLKNTYPKLRIIYHGFNKGYGAALRTGFTHATKDLIFYTDGDGQYDIYDLLKIFPIMQEGIDIVNGYKIVRNDPYFRTIIGIVYLRMMRLLFNFHIRDVDCDFRLMRTKIFNHVKLKHHSGVICLEMIKKMEAAGYRFAEFPVYHYHRTYGKSQFFNFKRLIKTAYNILVLWYELFVVRDVPSKIVYQKEHVVNKTLIGNNTKVSMTS